ncbi:hypothetical protein KEP72_24850, partial [Escherichia coli]|nr:hypothetical protein [Escherichia coli]
EKTAIHTLNQSESSSLIVGSVHMAQKVVLKKHPFCGVFFNLFGVLIPIVQGNITNEFHLLSQTQ